MKSFKLTLLIFTGLLFSANIYAQSNRSGNWCGTDQYMEQRYKKNPELLEQQKLFDQYLIDNKDKIKAEMKANENSKQAINFIIPVVWHVVTYNGQGYVSKADIEDQMLTLNEDFQRLNADASNTRALFAPYAADFQVEFRLAHLDPNGNCTEGIVRVESPLALNADDNVKSVSYWDSKKYFNIWTVITMDGDNPPSIILGYAQFPTGPGGGIDNTYGVVMRYNYVSRTDRTLSHEVGHCLSLYHTFQGGCNGGGDQCSDTPPVANSTQGCSTTQNSCTNLSVEGPYGTNVVDQIENFMSYDNCQNMFSIDQKTRAYQILNSTSTSQGLNQLTTPGNLAFTGTADPYNPPNCAPIAEFSYNKEYLCEGDSVTFTDDSYNATVTGWNWTFNGGSPSSSTAPSPTITYNTSGIYNATFQPSSPGGNDLITKNSIITVSSLTADYVGPIVDGFENTTQFNNDWIIGSGNDASDWENTTSASATGSRSIMIDNFSVSSSGSDEDFIISPSYDLSASPSKLIKFKVAYAEKDAANSDVLWVHSSTDCGASWQPKLPFAGNNLITAPVHTNNFVPTASEWVEKTLDFTSLGSATNLRLRFRFEAGAAGVGNNIYLDDINIGGTVGVEDFSNIASFNVYPNPTNSSAQISFNLMKGVNNLSIVVRNAVGQEVTNVINGQSFSAGKYTLKIDEQRKLSSGLYFVEFNADNHVRVQKLIVQ